MSTGALSPPSAAIETFKTGLKHLSEPLTATFLKSVAGGLLLASAGQFALTLACGSPGLKESNPALPRMLQGLAFPVGLVLVYFIGAELFTGYPMWYTITALERKGTPRQYLVGPLTSYMGNLIGAIFVSGVLSTATGALTTEPFRSGIIEEITESVLEQPWHGIFLRAIGCGYLVTLAMYLGTQNQDGISKAISLHLPFFISTVSKFPHTVEYMYIGTLGLFLRTPGFSVATFVGKCLAPVVLGNLVGGGAGTGLWLWWIYVREERGKGFVRLGGEEEEDDE